MAKFGIRSVIDVFARKDERKYERQDENASSEILHAGKTSWVNSAKCWIPTLSSEFLRHFLVLRYVFSKSVGYYLNDMDSAQVSRLMSNVCIKDKT